MIHATQNPALALVADLMQTLPGQITTSIQDRDGYEAEVLNVTIQQHPISGNLAISVRPGSPLEAPTHFPAIQALAQRHSATFDLPSGFPLGAKPKRPTKLKKGKTIV